MQLIYGFGIVLFFVIILGVASFRQTNEIFQQFHILYNHPLQIRRAIGNIRSDVYMIHWALETTYHFETYEEMLPYIEIIRLHEESIQDNLAIIREKYLGPKEDIENLSYEINHCKANRDMVFNLTAAENTQLAKEINVHKETVIRSEHMREISEAVDAISNFSLNKADNLYLDSKKLFKNLTIQLIFLVLIILLFSISIIYLLVKITRTPLKLLTEVAQKFDEGDLTARCNYESLNEFGHLALSFNKLADNIEENITINVKTNELSKVMLSEEDETSFFKRTLTTLIEITGAQMAAIYKLSNDARNLVYIDSVGYDQPAKESFSTELLEGEFGVAVSNQKKHHYKLAADDTRFVFNTVGGKFIPKEIICIPIIYGNKTEAIISLANLNNFSKTACLLIDKIHDMLCSRILGILSNSKKKELSEILEKTNKELLEQQMKLSKASSYNRALIEASIDPMATIGPDGIITDVNEATVAVTGITRKDLIGTDFSNYFTEPEKAKAGYQKVFNEGFVKNYELAIKNVNGEITPVFYNASVYHDTNGNIIGVFATARDISEQKLNELEMKRLHDELTVRSENMALANLELEVQKNELSAKSEELKEQNIELEMQKKQLDEANKLKTNFLSNMSHELRTPLNSVIALSGVLNRRLENKIPLEEYSYLSVIERNGKHLLNLINDILDLSRIEAGREDIDVSVFNVCNSINEITSMIMPQANNKNLIIEKVKGNCSLQISSDSNKFRHIIQNLIGNAVKFTEKGEISITVIEKNNYIEIEVEDTGIGISKQHLSHIFDEFRQADGSTSRKYGGTGLGLSIARKYALLLGGNIKVESTLNKGSKFTLELPLYFSEKKSNEQNEFKIKSSENKFNFQIPAVYDFSDKNILLVEDSDVAVIQIKDILEETGLHIEVANDGVRAMEIMNNMVPDAIILDLMMPGIDGFEVLNRIRASEKTMLIPVLILTAKHITPQDLKALNSNNVFQLIQKGDINRSEMLISIYSMLLKSAKYKVNSDQLNPKFDDKNPIVLIVEDNHDNMLTTKALLGEKYNIIEAYNGLEGVELATKFIPDLILMDIALPEMDGIEAFKKIRCHKLLSHIPIIAVTASALASDKETILSFGFDAYISKPINETVFFSVINKVLLEK